MSQMSDYLENKLVDHIFRGYTYSLPSSIYVGLHTASPTDAGGNEVSGNAYARAGLAPSASNWQSTNGTTSGPSTGTGGQTQNAGTITFPVPTASWGSVTHFGIYDALSGGNLLFWAALAVPKTINQGDTVSFAGGTLTVTLA
jgi:hypothetical protein